MKPAVFQLFSLRGKREEEAPRALLVEGALSPGNCMARTENRQGVLHILKTV